jgi:hypothetical protein
MLDRTKYPETPEYILRGAKELLELMNYDITKEIHPQFVERYGEDVLKGARRRKVKEKKSLPSKKK